jgi:light-regulated signal transduction histidine kinase (bacteriophytochrome)
MASADVLQYEVERLAARVATLEREKAQLEAFAAVAAHELVEPLVMTEAYASILSERLHGPDHADSRQDLDALARGVARMRVLAESLLHEARSDDRELELKQVDVGAMVRDCVELLRPEIGARRAHVEVEDLPDVVAEEALLSGVFSNLLINALKYSPREGATIHIGGAREPAECRYFIDSEGPAIPFSERERIFELYQRGRDERRVSGAGLGLAICRRIVERHGGTIGVVSLNGSGNRFQFTLPA